MVARPGDYPWSSYRHNAEGRFGGVLIEHAIYRALGATPAARQASYRALFAEGLGGALIDMLRDATQRGWVPGGERFQREIAEALGCPPRRGRPPKLKSGDEPRSEREGFQ